MTHYAKIKSSELFIPTHPGGFHKMGCCDCGLVHNMKFTAWLKKHKNGKLVGYQKLSRQHVVVMIQAERNERATAAKRRAKQVCVKRKKR